MKILYTITKGEIGGAQVHVAQLLESMRRDGHDVALMTTPGGFLEEKARSLGVTFYSNIYFANSFNPFRLIRALREIKKAIRQFSPDIVHTHSSFAGILTRLSLKGRIPTIFTAHSWAFTDGASTFRKIIAPISERIVSKWTTKIICVSEYDRNVALRYAIAPREKLTIVYNGVSEVSADKKEDFCISVGRLAYPKEFLLLLQSFKLAGSSKLFIVGAGPDEEIIKAEIARLGLSERITLLGALLPEETRNKIAQAKTFLLFFFEITYFVILLTLLIVI
jgi:glycosyltransferase involved in cell wall biosynthesis